MNEFAAWYWTTIAIFSFIQLSVDCLFHFKFQIKVKCYCCLLLIIYTILAVVQAHDVNINQHTLWPSDEQ